MGVLLRIPASLRILRPVNLVLTFAAVMIGGWLGLHAVSGLLFIAAISAALIAGSGYIHNDMIDLEVDRVSHPARPLPTGLLSRQTARTLALLTGSLGLGLSVLLPPSCTLIAIATVLILFSYNARLKHIPLAGNLCVAILGGTPILFGGLAVGHPAPALIPASLAATVHLAREMVKDLQDAEGDRLVDSRSLPHVAGTTGSKALITVALGSLLIAIPLPAYLLITGPVYLLLALIIDALILLIGVHIWDAHKSVDFEPASRLLKGILLLGLAAFLIDAISF